MGNPKYPRGTNHFNPNSPLFKPDEREYSFSNHPFPEFLTFLTGKAVVQSNVSLLLWAAVMYHFGRDFFWGYYLVPWVVRIPPPTSSSQRLYSNSFSLQMCNHWYPVLKYPQQQQKR